MAEIDMAIGGTSDDHKENSECQNIDTKHVKSQQLNDTLSGYNGIDPTPVRQLSWQGAIQEIKKGKYQKQIERARQILNEEGREAYKKFKRGLPAVTFGGVFSYRKNECIEHSTGFIIPDLDHLDDVDRTFNLLCKDENVWFAFKSPGGDGIKCGLRAENIKSDADHKQLFDAAKRYFKENYEKEIDESCKDISRLTFMSHDPDAFINSDPTYFNINAWTVENTPSKITLPEIPANSNGDGKEKYARKVLDTACQKIADSTPGNMHSTRLAMARLVGGYLHYGISDSEALDALETAVAASDTVNIESSMKTVRDGLEHGKRSPVTIPEKCGSSDGLRSDISSMLKMDVIGREVARNELSKKYNVRKSIIDQFVKVLEEEKRGEGTTDIVSADDPWTSAVDGAELLLSIKKMIQRHVILPAITAVAVSVWILLTFCFDAFRILALLGIISPEKRCGKTTLMDILQAICNRALLASNISASAVFRTIEKYQPTLLIDEADSFLKDNEELRGVLNSGHTRSGAFVIRVQGDDHEPVKFSTWAPKAIAMIGELPGTLQDRSIMVRLRRKAPGERVQKISVDFKDECQAIRQKCQRWSDDNFEKLKSVNPEVPDTGNDRQADNWYPLLCIAHVAGGEWPDLIKNSMIGNSDADEDSITTLLLTDIRDIFKHHSGEKIFSDVLCDRLKNIEDHPWADWNRGKGLTQNGLARLLKPFRIFSKTMLISGEIRKGYEKISFDDTFKRYLSPETPFQSVKPLRTSNDNAFDDFQSVKDTSDLTDEKQPKHLQTKAFNALTDENGYSGEDIEYSDSDYEWRDPEEQEGHDENLY